MRIARKILPLLVSCFLAFLVVGCEKISKSKASEVGPAAGMYIKLQEAYAYENKALGDFAEIGYVPPDSKIFEYSVIKEDDKHVNFLATSKENLGKCKKGSVWGIKSTVEEDDRNGDVKVIHLTTQSDPQNCLHLTPNFEKLGS